MRLAKEAHRTALIELLTNPRLSLNSGEGETLEQAATTYLELLKEVRGAVVGIGCDCLLNGNGNG